jgi:hypothetical protein
MVIADKKLFGANPHLFKKERRFVYFMEVTIGAYSKRIRTFCDKEAIELSTIS